MNKIHPTVILEGQIDIGNNNVILPNTIIIGPVSIGDNNVIGPNVVIGSPAQDTKTPFYDSRNKKIRIGNNNIIREFVGIHKPIYQELTTINNDIYIMQGCVINHDCVIKNNVVLASNVSLAGLCQIMDGAYLSMGVTVAQRMIVGAFSIIAMGSPVIKNIKPFLKYIPNKEKKVNYYALNKYGFSEFTNEIEHYVLNDKEPIDLKIKKYTDEYNFLINKTDKLDF